MNAPFIHLRFLLVLTVMSVITISCKKKDDPQPSASLRAPIDYNLLKSTTPYKQYFVDAKGDSTVDRTEGRVLLRMLTAIHVYCKSAVIDSAVLSNMFQQVKCICGSIYRSEWPELLHTTIHRYIHQL